MGDASEPSPPIDAGEIDRAAGVLRGGGVVVFPTETVYGLGADALSERAVERVFATKGRPRKNPLIVHVADEAMATRVVASWPARAGELARRFWPGPLTLVLPKAEAIPDLVTAGHRTVGVRCPDHPVAQALLRAFGGPIVGPSANRSGRVSPTTAAHARESLGDAGVMVLDGGACRAGIESTVLSLATTPPRVLRPGVIPREDLGEDVQISASGVDALPQSPGRLASHYAPCAPVRLFEGREWPGVLEGAPERTVVVSHGAETIGERGVAIVRMPEGAGAYAARLYAALREADAMEPTLILVERPEETGGLWAAIQDRLERAASPRD